MNEYDPMKDNKACGDFGGRSYTHQTDDGRSYINPDGSHGFIYTPDEGGLQSRTRRYKNAVIMLAMVTVTLFLVVCGLAGAVIAARHLGGEQTPSGETGTSPEQNTSGGLIIRDDTSVSGDEVLGGASPNGSNEERDEAAGSGNCGTLPAASIVKLPPKRADIDGDGLAEIETDSEGQVLTSAGNSNLSVATVVNRVAASVVEIITESVAQWEQSGQYVTSGAGSGVIISKEGFIVTNHHVIEGASAITVRLNNGKEFDAIVVGTDAQTDIAVLWVDAADYTLTVATLGASFDLVAGEDILAIGNPMGSLGGTVTEGMVSAAARQIKVNSSVMNLLQVSAPINPGNSGGGLFNLAGELVGIVNAKIVDKDIEGLGFAIPIDTAYEVILEIIDYGYVRGRPDLGFAVVDVTSVQTAMRYFNSFYTGVYVYDDTHAVVEYGDLILWADGVRITAASQLEELVNEKTVGDGLELIVYRDGSKQTVTVTVADRSSETEAKTASE